jgi:hypothetical protein
MVKLWIKAMPVIICFLLALLLLPGAGKVNAQDAQEGYSLKIIEPADGSTVNRDGFHLKFGWTKPSSTWSVHINGEIKPVIFEDTVPNPEFSLDTVFKFSGFTQLQHSGTETLPYNLYFGTRGFAPAGLYEIKVSLVNDAEENVSVATARSTFHYPPSNMQVTDHPVVVYFNAEPFTIKVGSNVTLSWKVTGADSVSIDQGIGIVENEGSIEVSPIDVESLNPAAGSDYTAQFILTATNSQGDDVTASKTVSIIPLTIDEIFAEYEKWGNRPYIWPDGTRDPKALVGPSWCGGFSNFWKSFTSVTNIGSYEGVRWDCNATQYRTLVFLNELKEQGRLIGWDYMGVRGAAVYFRSGPYAFHHAAAIWEIGEDWTQTATIFDPFNTQSPCRYSVTDGLDSIAPWEPDDYYSEVYPSVPDGEAIKYNQYFLDEFDKNIHNRWGNGGGTKTPWQNPETLQSLVIRKAQEAWAENVKKPIEDVLDTPLKDVYKMVGLFCPANLLITNDAGQRLGKLADGTVVTEFQPLDAYYWSDVTGDKQWVFGLLDGTYKIDITGSSSGNFRLLTYTGGDNINDYGENPIANGQQMVLSMQPGAVSELILADGTKVIPEAKAIESFLPLKPAPTTEPTPAPTSTPEDKGLNLSFIGSVIGGVIVILLLLFLFGRRKK